MNDPSWKETSEKIVEFYKHVLRMVSGDVDEEHIKLLEDIITVAGTLTKLNSLAMKNYILAVATVGRKGPDATSDYVRYATVLGLKMLGEDIAAIEKEAAETADKILNGTIH